jgi:hypothetical protein
MLAREVAQAPAFGAEHERKRTREVRVLKGHARLFGEAHAEKAAISKLRQALREILDENHRHEVERPARGLGKRARKRRAVPLGHDETRSAERRGRAQGGADILRIRHLIEHEKEGGGIDVLERERRERFGIEDDALMDRVGAEKPVEVFGASGFGLEPAPGEKACEFLRRVLGGENPHHLPPRIGERSLRRVEAEQP